MPTQVRYSDAEVEQIKTLFPDADSLKLYRRYLLDLPLTPDEITRIKATWAPSSVRAIIQKVTLPVIDGNEPIGVGYDLLNNISLKETDFEHQVRYTSLFLKAVFYLNSRIQGLDKLSKAASGKGQWLTSSVLDGVSRVKDPLFTKENTTEVLEQLCIKQNVEGILLGLQGIINTKFETSEEKAARETADRSY
jgi:hypothetical protein